MVGNKELFAQQAQMNDSKRTTLLEAIDRFRALGIAEDTPLPQLVVVGDQSSGKSSLLERLTGISFPVSSDLCTRFATHIILRRTKEEDPAVRVSIITGPSSSLDEDHKAKLAGFARDLQSSDFDTETFTAILNEASACMDLPGPDTENSEHARRFSDDVLRIELSGPQHEHLSVVDVPGLFHNATAKQTIEDKELIRELIGGYVRDSRTIILGVLDGRVNLANQEVFQMARAADPEGLRTVGIITKCDAVHEGDEDNVINISKNETKALKHGWFWVKNRSTKEIMDGVSIQQSIALETQFFQKKPWFSLDRARVGIVRLKAFLSDLLYNHTRSEWPALLREIKGKLDQDATSLEKLGAARRTWREQRQFLNQAASFYENSVRDYTLGRYKASFSRDHELKLRKHLADASEDFTETMRKEGHVRDFKRPEDSQIHPPKAEVQDTPDVFRYKKGLKGSKKSKSQVETKQFDFVWENSDSGTLDDIYVWIRDTYRCWRGAELPGTVNPAVLELLFREQAKPWESLAKGYFQDVRTTVERFNQALFTQTIQDETVRERLITQLQPSIDEAFDAGSKQLSVIVADEMAGHLQTVNHYFAETLTSIREERLIHRFKVLEDDPQIQDWKAADFVKRTNISNEDAAVFDIHDILKSYYEVAIKRFIDNVVNQVVERYFLGEDGPVKLFSTQWVASLDEEELKAIASEDFNTSLKRTEYENRIERISEALKVAEGVAL